MARPKRQFVPNKKGEPRKYGGAKKGVPHRATRFLKDAILLAGTEVGDVNMYMANLSDNDDHVASSIEERGGLVGYLRWLAVHEPKSYTALLGRLVPQQVSLTPDDEKPSERFTTPEQVAQELAKRGLPTAPIFGSFVPKAIEYTPEEEKENASGE